MKSKLITFLILLSSFEIQAQFLDNLAKKAEKAVERTVERKVEEKAEKTTEEKIEEGKKISQ